MGGGGEGEGAGDESCCYFHLIAFRLLEDICILKTFSVPFNATDTVPLSGVHFHIYCRVFFCTTNNTSKNNRQKEISLSFSSFLSFKQ